MSVNATQIELLRKVLRHGAKGRVVRMLQKFRAADLADIFKHLTPPEQKSFIDVLYQQEQAAATLLELPQDIFVDILELMKNDMVAKLVDRMAADDAVYTLGLFDNERADAVIALLSDEHHRKRIEFIRAYPKESAGSLMTDDMLTLDEDFTVGEAIDRIRELAADSEFVSYVYVVNEHSTFLGVVPLRRMIAARPEQTLKAIMVVNPVAVRPMDDQEKVAELTARYNLLAVPVVDDNFTLLGVITVDDVIDVLQAEATEDMYRMQFLSDEDRVSTPVTVSVRKRFPWMVLNLLTAFLAASVIALFEASITEVVVLATLMPVVAGMGGNTGTQTLTVITRGIALGELDAAEGARAIARQMLVGLMVGAGIGLIAAGVTYLWKGNPYLGGVLFLAMLTNLSIAGFAGAAVPIVLKSLNQDPALGGSVIVTTFTDICGFMAFLGLATLFLSQLS